MWPIYIERDLATITSAIHAYVSAIAIHLFGSYAHGQSNEDSDLDICVVVPDTDADTVEQGTRIQLDLFKKVGTPLGLHIGKKTSFERRKEMHTLENIVVKQGIKLYGN